MVDSAASTSTAQKKKTQPKKVADHPKYSEMIKQAIASLKERGGSSRQAILKYIVKNFNAGNEITVNTHLKMALRNGVKNESLKQSKGTGASGSFKLGDAAKKVAKPKKVAAKKPKAPKKSPAKKATKTTKTKTDKPKKETKAKKSPKKAAKTTKKDAKPKKTATKKSPAKKTTKPKAATKTTKPKAAAKPKTAAKKPAAKKPAAKKTLAKK